MRIQVNLIAVYALLQVQECCQEALLSILQLLSAVIMKLSNEVELKKLVYADR